MRHRGPSGVRLWTRLALALLFAAGTLLQACSDNNGSTGPTFACREGAFAQSPTRSGSVRLAENCTATPAPVVGDGIGGPVGGIFVQVTVSPGTVDIGRRASVTVIATSKNGVRLGGQHDVFLTTSVGSLDATSGKVVDGIFRTTLYIPCEVAAASPGNVIAIVDGAPSAEDGGAFTAVTATANNPCS